MRQLYDVWELRKDEALLGTLNVYDSDMFWQSAQFEPTTAFEPYRPHFDSVPESVEDFESGAWETWMDQVIGLGLTLVRLRDHARCQEFILYIRGDQATFRGIIKDAQ